MSDEEALQAITARLGALREKATDWPDGPPGYRLAVVSDDVYVAFAEPDNDRNNLSVVYVVGADGAEDEPVLVAKADLLTFGEWKRGEWETALLGVVQ